MNITNFKVNDSCIGCGLCTKVCPGGILYIKDQKAYMNDIHEFGWNGCWKCEHCLSVCPKGAIEIFNKKPKSHSSGYDFETKKNVLNSIIENRHSCRRFLKRELDKSIIYDMIKRLGNAPNGGNKEAVEFTLIDDQDTVNKYRELIYTRMEELAKKGIYPKGYDEKSYNDMKQWENTVRPDMLFCGAPYILIPHAKKRKEAICDVMIASAYFELLCASRDIGCIFMSFPLDVLDNMPDLYQLLNIPCDHYVGAIIGFGYPEVQYTSPSQRIIDENEAPWISHPYPGFLNPMGF